MRKLCLHPDNDLVLALSPSRQACTGSVGEPKRHFPDSLESKSPDGDRCLHSQTEVVLYQDYKVAAVRM